MIDKAGMDEIARLLGFFDWPSYLSWWHRHFYNIEMPKELDPYTMKYEVNRDR